MDMINVLSAKVLSPLPLYTILTIALIGIVILIYKE